MIQAPLVRSTELRRTPRFKPQGKVRVTCCTSVDDRNLATALLDVSAAGIRLKLRTLLPQGTTVLIAVQRLNRMRPIIRKGTVRWSIPGEDGGCVAGVELAVLLAAEVVARLIEGKDSGQLRLHDQRNCSRQHYRQCSKSLSITGRRPS